MPKVASDGSRQGARAGWMEWGQRGGWKDRNSRDQRVKEEWVGRGERDRATHER